MIKVLKFGGTSLGNATRIRTAVGIVRGYSGAVVVCSAMAGMTNALIEVSAAWKNGNPLLADLTLENISRNFFMHCEELFVNHWDTLRIQEEVNIYFLQAQQLLRHPHSPDAENALLAVGELSTSFIFNAFLNLSGTPGTLIHALDFIRLNSDDDPDLEDISTRLRPVIHENHFYVTQGFIAANPQGKVANLKRGGSDYSATLIGAAIHAPVIEIWTDIDGLHNNDPRHVANTRPVRRLSYAEAAELAYFGAKILHPSCVLPARQRQIPIQLKNSLDPDAPGTLINAQKSGSGISAIAAKDNITILRITSARMFNAYGFLGRLFAVFEQARVPVDVVTTSEVSVSMTIEDTSKLPALEAELEKLGRVDIEQDRCIVCVVGAVLEPGHVAEIMRLIKPFNVRMISLGASSNNITFVIEQSQKSQVLNALQQIFGPGRKAVTTAYQEVLSQ